MAEDIDDSYKTGELVDTPSELRLSDAEMADVILQHGNVPVSDHLYMGFGSTIPGQILHSWRENGAPPVNTEEYRNWWLEQSTKTDGGFSTAPGPEGTEQAALRRTGKKIPAAIELYPLISAEPNLAVDFGLSRTIIKTKAISVFESEYGTQQEYASKLKQEAQEAGVSFVGDLAVERDYLVRKNSFISDALNKWKNYDVPIEEIFVGDNKLEEEKEAQLIEVSERINRGNDATPNLLRPEQRNKIITTIDEIKNKYDVGAPASIEVDPLLKTSPLSFPKPPGASLQWWKKAPWQPWYDENTKTYNVVIRPDGKSTKPFTDKKINKSSVSFERLNSKFVSDIGLSPSTPSVSTTYTILEEKTRGWLNSDALTLLIEEPMEAYRSELAAGGDEDAEVTVTFGGLARLYAVGMPQFLVTPQATGEDGTAQIEAIKKTAVDQLLKFHDKQGQYIQGLAEGGQGLAEGSDNGDIIQKLSEKAVVDSYYYGAGDIGFFKVTISAPYINGIDRVEHAQSLFNTTFGDSPDTNFYYDNYWVYKINIKDWDKRIEEFKGALTSAQESLDRWKEEEVGETTPEDFSFKTHFTEWEIFKKDLLELLKINDDPDLHIYTATDSILKPPKSINLVVDQNYVPQGVYTELADGKKYPVLYHYEEYKNKSSFGRRNIFYTIYMDLITQELTNSSVSSGQQPWQEVIKLYPIIYSGVKITGECEEPPNKDVMTFAESKEADKYYSNLQNQRCFFEKIKKKSPYPKGDPTFTQASGTLARINNLKSAYSEFLDDYNKKRIIREIIVCLMQIIGLNMSCRQLLKMTLQAVPAAEFIEKVIVPLVRYAQELGQAVAGMVETSFAGTAQAIDERITVLKSEYYRNAYELRLVGSDEEKRKKLIKDNNKILDEILKLQENKKIADSWLDSLENVDQFLDELEKLYDLEELCANAALYLEQVMDWLLNGDDDDGKKKDRDADMFPDPPVISFERLFTKDLLAGLTDGLQKAVFSALDAALTEVVKGILRVIQKICTDFRITYGDDAGAKTPNPLSKDDLKGLFDDLVGNTKPLGFDNLQNDLTNADVDLVDVLGALLDSILDSLSPSLFCRLMAGNANDEELNAIRLQFWENPTIKSAFPDNDSVKMFFINMGGIVDAQFCTSLLEVTPQQIVDNCDFSAEQIADDTLLGQDNAQEYEDLKNQLGDLLDQLLDLISQDLSKTDLPNPTEQPCVDKTKPEAPDGAPQNPDLDWKKVPIMAHINKKAIDSFYETIIDTFKNGVPNLIRSTNEMKDVKEDLTHDFKAEDDARVRELLDKMMAGTPFTDDDRTIARKIYVAGVLEGLKRSNKAFQLKGVLTTEIAGRDEAEAKKYIKLGIIDKKEISFISQPLALGDWNIPRVKLIARQSGNDPEKAARNKIIEETEGGFSTAEQVRDFNNKGAITYSDPLNGVAIYYSALVPTEVGPAEKLRRKLGGDTGTRFGHLQPLYQLSDDGQMEISTQTAPFSFRFDLPAPARSMLNALPQDMAADIKDKDKRVYDPHGHPLNIKSAMVRLYPILEFDINSRLASKQLDNTKDPNSTIDNYTISYEKKVQLKNKITLEDHPAAGTLESYFTPNIVEGKEHYKVHCRDYVENSNPYNFSLDMEGNGNKAKYFFDFLIKKTAEFDFGEQFSRTVREAQQMLANAPPGHTGGPSTPYKEIISQVLYNTFTGMDPVDREESSWQNPLFDYNQMSNLELIASHDARRVRANQGTRPKTEEEIEQTGNDEPVKLTPQEPRGDLLSLEAIKEMIKEQFLGPPACSDDDDPYGNKDIGELQTAALAGVIYLILRVYTVEFLLKVLPCMSNYKMGDVFISNIAPTYIVQRMKMEMIQEKKQNYYCEFMLGVKKIFYDRIKKTGVRVFIDPIDGQPVPVVTDDQKIIFLLREQLASLEKEYEYILKDHIKKTIKTADIAGSGEPTMEPVIEPAEEWRPFADYDSKTGKITLKSQTTQDTIFSHFNADYMGKVFDVPINSQGIYGANSSTHYSINAYSQNKLFLERYVRVRLQTVDVAKLEAITQLMGASKPIYRPQELEGVHFDDFTPYADVLETPSLTGVVNFQVWEEFMDSNRDFFRNTPVSDYFEKISFGVRVLYIPEANLPHGYADTSYADSLFYYISAAGRYRQTAQQEKAFEIIEVHPPKVGERSKIRSTKSWVLMDKEFDVQSSYVWPWMPHPNLNGYMGTLAVEKKDIWKWLLEELYQTEEYKYLFKYIIPSNRLFGTAFVQSELFISNCYYETNSSLNAPKYALQKLFFTLSSEDGYATEVGCDNDFALGMNFGDNWADMLENLFGKNVMQVIMDTLLAALAAALKLAGGYIDPFGILKMILCPFLDPDHKEFGGLMKKMKDDWGCKDFPSFPDLDFPSPDNCPPHALTSCIDLKEEFNEYIPSYFESKIVSGREEKEEIRRKEREAQEDD
jgi:hypothetical protein